MTIVTITKEQFYKMTAREIAVMFAKEITAVNGKTGTDAETIWYKKIHRYGKDWAWHHNEFMREYYVYVKPYNPKA